MTELCDITLNLMRLCTMKQELLVFEAIEGMYYFDATPMALVGTKILMNLKPI